jgi:hypothetical protein
MIGYIVRFQLLPETIKWIKDIIIIDFGSDKKYQGVQILTFGHNCHGFNVSKYDYQIRCFKFVLFVINEIDNVNTKCI